MAAASREIENCEVFEARITSSRAAASARRRTSHLTSKTSTTVSITWSASATASSSAVEPADPRPDRAVVAGPLEPSLDAAEAALERRLVDLDDRHVEARARDDLGDPAAHLAPAPEDDDAHQ